jgi:hypothetical protein
MDQLRWYLEHFLDYPFDPEIGHASHVLQAWGTQAFNALFDRRHAATWLAASEILQIRSDDPHILSWPWKRSSTRNAATSRTSVKSSADKQKLEAIWRDANLGPFPTEPTP